VPVLSDHSVPTGKRVGELGLVARDE
jgi:hypothetical protein